MYGPLPSGQYLVVVIDEYSRFPEVEITNSTSSMEVIPKLERMFTSYGYPANLKSDNGPPFNSREFKLYARRSGFKHQKITPEFARANGLAENFMKNLGKIIRCSLTERKDWKFEIRKMLMNYRATPHPSTGKTPAELMFGRKLKIKLPDFVQQEPEKNGIENGERQMHNKNMLKNKRYHDKHGRVKFTKFKEGERVLVKNTKRTKYEPRYRKEIFEIEIVKGRMVTAKNKQGKHITRDKTFFKTYHGCENNEIDINEFDEDLEIERILREMADYKDNLAPAQNNQDIPQSPHTTDTQQNVDSTPHVDTHADKEPIVLRRSGRIRKPNVKPDYLYY